MARHFKIDDALDEQQRAEVLRMALDRKTTTEALLKMVRGFGVGVGRTAVYNWMQFVRDDKTESVRPVIQLLRDGAGKVKADTLCKIRALVEADLAGA
jgi:hypothetical protein